MGLGENLVRLRKLRGMNRKELAQALGIPYTTLRNYETGQREPGRERLIQMAELLSTTVDSLVGFPVREDAKSAPSLPDEALKVAKEYSELDQPGKNVVKVVLAEEGKRVAEERARRREKELWYDNPDEFGEQSDPRVIPLYYTPAAAGYTSPAFGEDFEYLQVGGEVPRQADFAVQIEGDSMEPYIMDGATVYVNRDPLKNGDVGIFFLDGDMLCKQYYKDEKGQVRLLSLNRSRADADRYVRPGGDSVLTCYGRVILPKQPKISL